MQIFIASDHAGFELKASLVEFLRGQGRDVEDLGPSIYIEGDDYPDTLAPLAQKVAQIKGSFGIVIGGSGQGEAMVCNRVPGVRAAVFYGMPQQNLLEKKSGARFPKETEDPRGLFRENGSVEALNVITLSREHNDANVLSLGARFVTVEEAQEAVQLFLGTNFSGEERHARRIAKLG